MTLKSYYLKLENGEYVDTRTGEILSYRQSKYRSTLNPELSEVELRLTSLSTCITEEDLELYGKLYDIKPVRITYNHAHTVFELSKGALNILLALFNTPTYNGHGVFNKAGYKHFQYHFNQLVEHGYVRVLWENKQRVRYYLTQRTVLTHNPERDGIIGAVIAKRRAKVVAHPSLLLCEDVIALSLSLSNNNNQ